jgi:predicted transcriptional regulator
MYFDGYTEMQSLILSAQIISVRVILKFCKGEKPHWMRVPVWKKGLEIAEYFEKRGLISEKKICYFIRDGYVFRCWVYDVDGLGEIILPEHAFDLSFPAEMHGDYNSPPLWNPPMPPLMEHTGGILKKYAARMIEAFSFENEIENREQDNSTDIFNAELNKTGNAVLNIISKNKKVTPEEISVMTNLAVSTIKKYISRLKKKGIITHIGSKKTGKWQII